MLCILWTMYKNIISEILEDRLDELKLFGFSGVYLV
jgi:hypothetical protein